MLQRRHMRMRALSSQPKAAGRTLLLALLEPHSFAHWLIVSRPQVIIYSPARTAGQQGISQTAIGAWGLKDNVDGGSGGHTTGQLTEAVLLLRRCQAGSPCANSRAGQGTHAAPLLQAAPPLGRCSTRAWQPS